MVGRGVYRSYYKGHEDNLKGVGGGGVGRRDGEKMQTTVIE